MKVPYLFILWICAFQGPGGASFLKKKMKYVGWSPCITIVTRPCLYNTSYVTILTLCKFDGFWLVLRWLRDTVYITIVT